MPDVELKPQVYKDPRPKEYFDPLHERVRRGPPGPFYELCRVLAVPYAAVVFRARALNSERVPNGQVILAPNHASFLDHFFTGAFIRRRIQFMGKSQLFDGGIGEWIFTHGGVFPVRRGYQDEDAFVTAFQVLDRGGAIVMYCEGGRSRTGKIGEEARPGIGRLALESGAPVVPVAILGSHQVRNWKRGRFPRVTVQYGEPFRFDRVEHSSRERQQRVADYILERIRELYGQLAERGHPSVLRGGLTPSPPQPPPGDRAPGSPTRAS
jgi:1-acyl-sn-glycerol-3-phosphate acyltransferase